MQGKLQIGVIIVAVLAALTQAAPDMIPLLPKTAGVWVLILTNILSAALAPISKTGQASNGSRRLQLGALSAALAVGAAQTEVIPGVPALPPDIGAAALVLANVLSTGLPSLRKPLA